MNGDVVRFLAPLWGEGLHSLCAKGRGRFRLVDFFSDPGNLVVAAGQLNGDDVWFGVNPLAELPIEGRGGADDVASVSVLVADLDWAHEAHRTEGLPTESQVRAHLRALGGELAPTAVVASGHGLQCYWHFDHPLAPQEAAGLQLRLDTALAEVGLRNDRSDAASILRLPGTINHKADPVAVTIERHDDGRYTSEYLAKRLPKAVRTRERHRDEADPADLAAIALLERLGGHSPRWARDHWEITRPGKDEGCSATVGARKAGAVFVHSTNWEDLPSGGYSAWELRKVLGDPEPKVKVPPRSATFIQASSVHTTLQRWLWEARIPRGELTLAAGREKLGKSTAMAWVAARVTVGELPGDLHGIPSGVLFVSAEDHYGRVLVPRLDVAGAVRERVWLLDPTGPGFHVDAVHDLAPRLALVVLDPLSVFIDVPVVAEHGETATRNALLPFVELAQDFELAVVGVRHFNKRGHSDNPFDVILGARGYTAASRSVLFFAPDVEQPDRAGGLVYARGNLAGQAPGLRYRLDIETLELDDGNKTEVPKFAIDGATTITLDDALFASRDDISERDRAGALLIAALAGEPVPARDIEQMAREEDISMTTLKRARRGLGVLSERVGGLGADGYWVWSLPKESRRGPVSVVDPLDDDAKEASTDTGPLRNPLGADPPEGAP